jgi:hypothetical protein
MKSKTHLVAAVYIALVALCISPLFSFGQGTPIATTAFTRTMLRGADSAAVRTSLGFLSTNNTVITNYVGNGASITNLNADELRSGTVPLARLSGITATQIANDTLTTNKVDSTFYNLLTNTASGGSGDVTQAGLAAGSYSVADRLSKFYYVSPIVGDDSTGTTNDPFRPYRLIETVRPLVSAGDVVILSAGTHNLTNSFTIPVNGAVIGAGTNLTTLYHYGTNITYTGLAFVMSDNSYLSGLHIDLAWRRTVTNASQPSWLFKYQAGVGGWQSSRFTNALVENVSMIGETDGIFISSTSGPISFYAVGLSITSRWDALALAPPAANVDYKFYVFDSKLDAAAGTNNINDIAGKTVQNNVLSMGNTNASVILVNCTMLASNASGVGVLNQNGLKGTNIVVYGGALTNLMAGQINAFATDGQRQDYYGTAWDSANIEDDFGAGTIVALATNVSPTSLKDFILQQHQTRKRVRP